MEGAEVCGIRLKKGKDAECEGDEGDGTLWGERQTHPTHSRTGLACFSRCVSRPQEAFKMGTQLCPITEQYRTIAVLRSLGSRSAVDLPSGEYPSHAATSSHFSNRYAIVGQ